MARAPGRSGTGRGRSWRQASGTLHRGRAGRARTRPRGAHPGSRRRRSRAARPTCVPWSPAGRPHAGTAAGRAGPGHVATGARRPPSMVAGSSRAARNGRSSRSSRYKRTEWLRPGRLRSGGDSGTERSSGARGVARVSRRADGAPSPAVAAEPLGIGTAGARDPLSVEVRLLGALLGQVISEQAGPELFALVERIRRRTISLRREDDPLERARLDDELRALDLDAAEAVIGAFTLYFGLVNLAEARSRVRTLRRRERAARDGILDDSLADAVADLRRLGRSPVELDALVSRLSIIPVLTAHPTEAR